MSESIAQRINATSLDQLSKRELRALLTAGFADSAALKTDVASLITQFNQLRTDYNANVTIATDTTATAVTNTSGSVSGGITA